MKYYILTFLVFSINADPVSIVPGVNDKWCLDNCKDAHKLDAECPNKCADGGSPPQTTPGVIMDVGGVVTPQLPGIKLLNQDCVGNFGPWSECSKPCAGGIQSRTFFVRVPASPTGKRCAKTHGEKDTRACNEQECLQETDLPKEEPAEPPILNNGGKPCWAISPEVSDWWCMKSCVADIVGERPPICKNSPLTPGFQKCACDDSTGRFGCWSTSPSVPDFWCSMTCTTMDAHGDMHSACKPGPFQECLCNFKRLPDQFKAPTQSGSVASVEGSLQVNVP